MRLLKTHSHPFERQGCEAGKVCQKKKEMPSQKGREYIRQREPSPYHPQRRWGEKLSTEKRKISTKSEAVRCPSRGRKFNPARGGGGGEGSAGHSMRLGPTKLILVGTRTTYQDMFALFFFLPPMGSRKSEMRSDNRLSPLPPY